MGWKGTSGVPCMGATVGSEEMVTGEAKTGTWEVEVFPEN